ncbi:PEP-CTERM sorting domain-containing protein [Paucibacter sp. AS339]|uniref:PEP-CTERM sorting domain-containing protein n=1 Tax=Paucibacter hankyongi TaxID=3133434 RepID=UPI0030B6632D
MTSAKFLKSGLAAAMVLFAASSFAGVKPIDPFYGIKNGNLEARMDLGKGSNPLFQVGDDFNSSSQRAAGSPNFNWTPDQAYKFFVSYSADTATISFDVKLGTKSTDGSIFKNLSHTETLAKGKNLGFGQVSLELGDVSGISIDVKNLTFNNVQVGDGTWGAGSKTIYQGSALKSYILTGDFTIKSEVKKKADGSTDWAIPVYKKNAQGQDIRVDGKRVIDEAKSTPHYLVNANNAAFLDVKFDKASVVPEPTTLALLPLALGGAFLASRRRKAAAK